jgi:hypothetical protein
MRKVYPRLLENSALTQNPAAATAAGIALPLIFNESGAIQRGKLLANVILQCQQKGFYVAGIR